MTRNGSFECDQDKLFIELLSPSNIEQKTEKVPNFYLFKGLAAPEIFMMLCPQLRDTTIQSTSAQDDGFDRMMRFAEKGRQVSHPL